MQRRHRFVDLGLKAMSRTHHAVVRLSRGRVLSRAFGMPVVELHTIGRTSGQDRTTMLTSPIVESDRVVLVASKGGDTRNPDWFRNLVDHPDVVVGMDGTLRAMRARVATEEERSVLWPRVVSTYRGYASYQRRTVRQIPLVICEPRPTAG